jgi:hypothetical protein
VKLAEMTLGINLYELTTPFESHILETERMETWGNCFKILIQKMYYMGKEIFPLSTFITS